MKHMYLTTKIKSMRFRFLLILGLMTIGALTNSALAGVSANFSTSKSFTDPSNSCSEVITITNKTTGQVSGVNYVYAWNWGDGNSEFSYAKATTPTHTYNYPGTFTITLDISDMSNQGVTLSSLTGTVTTKGAAPTVASNPVVYGPTYSGVNGLVTLNGGNSTTTSGTLTYLWTLDNPVIINGHSVSSFNTATVNLVIPTTISDQTFTATLTVTDPANTCATNSVAATAFTINHTAVAPTPIVAAFVPTANGTPNSGTCDYAVSITNTTNTVSGAHYSYLWYYGDGSSVTTTDASPAPAAYTYIYPGTYTIQLNVYDANGQYLSTVSHPVTTKGTGPSVVSVPVVYGPTYSGHYGLVTLNGGNSTTTSGTLSYLWTLDNPVIINGHSVSSFNTSNVNLSIPTSGSDQTFTATLTVTDPANTCATNSVAATAFTINHTAVAPTPIVAAFAPTANGTPNSGTCDYAVSISNTTNTVSGAHYSLSLIHI